MSPAQQRKARAIILAAGRGERMRPLTDVKPKPLLEVQGKPLIVWHIEALARAGVRDIVINTAWLEDQVIAAVGDGSRWDVRIVYSQEARDHGGALETAGGIAKALPFLDETFWIVSADIHAPDFPFAQADYDRFARSALQAHLWLVANPEFHLKGDFGIAADGLGLADSPGPDGKRWTYANLALARRDLCAHVPAGERAALGPLLYERMRERRISVQTWHGEWHNLGTPHQLQALNAATAAS